MRKLAMLMSFATVLVIGSAGFAPGFCARGPRLSSQSCRSAIGRAEAAEAAWVTRHPRGKRQSRAARLQRSLWTALSWGDGDHVILPAHFRSEPKQEIPTPILSSGLRGAVPVPTQVIEKLSQSPGAQTRLDTANMPPIESIEAASDIRPFLAWGVPEDLTRAALRRAWLVDPTIRDFIGLSENSWDFNAPSRVAELDSLTTANTSRPLPEETESSDSDPLAVDRLMHDQVPVRSGEALQPLSAAQGR
jgi:Protein of unknown function (DUF3306)